MIHSRKQPQTFHHKSRGRVRGALCLLSTFTMDSLAKLQQICNFKAFFLNVGNVWLSPNDRYNLAKYRRRFCIETMGSNATDKEKLLRETEAMLRAVLISSPRGVRFEKLQRDFRELTFKEIPYKELGYPRLENFLQSIPAVARVEREPNGDFVVKGVASSADQHVAKLISKQKKPTLRKSAKSMLAKRRAMHPQKNSITPVRKPTGRRPTLKFSTTKFVPPRMQRLQHENNKNKAVAARGNAQPTKSKGMYDVPGWCLKMGDVGIAGLFPGTTRAFLEISDANW